MDFSDSLYVVRLLAQHPFQRAVAERVQIIPSMPTHLSRAPEYEIARLPASRQ
jgi:hypothetical protein